MMSLHVRMTRRRAPRRVVLSMVVGKSYIIVVHPETSLFTVGAARFLHMQARHCWDGSGFRGRSGSTAMWTRRLIQATSMLRQ